MAASVVLSSPLPAAPQDTCPPQSRDALLLPRSRTQADSGSLSHRRSSIYSELHRDSYYNTYSLCIYCYLGHLLCRFCFSLVFILFGYAYRSVASHSALRHRKFQNKKSGFYVHYECTPHQESQIFLLIKLISYYSQ